MAFKFPEHHQAQSRLMSLPLELRHRIYEHINFRGRWEERQVLRDYLNTLDPQPNHGDDVQQTFGDDDNAVHEEAVEDEESEVDEDDMDSENQTTEEDDEDGLGDGEESADEDQHEDLDADTDTDQNPDTNADTSMADQEAEAEDTVQDDLATTTAPTETPPAEGIPPTAISRAPRPRNKYRHLPYLIYLSACPPPPTMLSLCQRMHEEATSHYYNSSSLHIETTKSFQHLTFFEETLKTIAQAPFSPFESMRKVSLLIVWDSAYINELAKSADPTDPDYERLLVQRPILENSLMLRVGEVATALETCAQLRELTVNIYDSKDTAEEVVLHNELLQPLMLLCYQKHALLKVEEHKLSEGQRPTKRSVIGRFRAELKQLVEHNSDIR